MKFAMGEATLTRLTSQTSGSSDELGALVKELAQSAEPLQGQFNGAGRAAFDRFKNEVDRISVDLNSALGAVLQGIAAQNTSFAQGDQEMSDQTAATQSGASFDAASFGSRKA